MQSVLLINKQGFLGETETQHIEYKGRTGEHHMGDHCHGIECVDLFIAQTAVYGEVVKVPVSEIQQTSDPQGFVKMVRILMGDEAVFDVGGGGGGGGV